MKITDEMVKRAHGKLAYLTDMIGDNYGVVRQALEAALIEPEEIPVTDEMIAACVPIENDFRQRWVSNTSRRNYLASIFRAMKAKEPKCEHVWETGQWAPMYHTVYGCIHDKKCFLMRCTKCGMTKESM